MFYRVLVICGGFLLDFLIGDPHWIAHPVRAIGKLISLLEGITRKYFPTTTQGEYLAGVLTSILTITLTGVVSLAILWGLHKIDPLAAFIGEIIMCYQVVAARSLYHESMKVYHALKKKDVEFARHAVSMIVGRDTEKLSEIEIAKAAVETVAENTSDGVIAPLFFLMIGGAPLGFCYKAINTLDSMIAYKNQRYLNFGRFAARLDDLANWIPARISAFMIILAAIFTGQNPFRSASIWKRDRFNHASPNSAQTESACAGALGIQLAGDTTYGGIVLHKLTIGDALRPIAIEDIRRANYLMYISSGLAIILFSLLYVLFMLFFSI